jgi:protein-tyrosine phosphatase
VIGHPIHRDASTVLNALGADSTTFAARQLTSKIASHADLILTMTKAHRDTVLELAPRQLRRAFTISEASWLASEGEVRKLADLATRRPHVASGEPLEISDPIGQSPEFFIAIGSQIAKLLPPILELCRQV